MEVAVLGSAAGGGFPQWNCACTGCGRARRGDPEALPRTQTSLAVRAGGRVVLLDASPDLREQAQRCAWLDPPPGTRSTPLAAVVLTGADVDKVAGLLTLREGAPFAIYATERVLAALAANPLFDVLPEARVPRRALPLGEPVELRDAELAPLGLVVRAFPVPGKVALWLEDEAQLDHGTAEGDSVGLDVRAGLQRFAYVPGCAAVTGAVVERVAGAGALFFDGTLFRDDELIAAGLTDKTGRRMGHAPMTGDGGSLDALSGVQVGRRIYLHLNNSNPALLGDSAERREVERRGFAVAYDGMVVVP